MIAQLGQCLAWAAVLIGFGAMAVALLFTPGEALREQYQNLVLARTQRPLKDEDFSSFPLMLWVLRLAGLLSVVTCVEVALLWRAWH